jgi:DNA-binding transcriptional MerR regulator
MEKADGAFLTIGEMARQLGVKTHILRYWEDQFPMLKPLTRAGGRRLYRPADAALLFQINDLLHRQHYTIKGAVAYLQKGGAVAAEPAGVPIEHSTVAADVRAELQAIRNRLSSALEAA